jgi:hypothetical protein
MTLDQASVSRELGNMEARLDRLEADVAEIKGDMKQVLELSTKARFGFSILASVATAGGALGAALPTLFKAMSGAAIIGCLLFMSGCAQETTRQEVMTFEVAAVATPVGDVGPFKGRITGESHVRAVSGPDYDQLQRGTDLLGGLVSNLPGPLGLVGGLGLSAAAGFLALKARSTNHALGQIVKGIDAAKTDLPDEHVEALKTRLAIATDEKTKRLIKDLRA